MLCDIAAQQTAVYLGLVGKGLPLSRFADPNNTKMQNCTNTVFVIMFGTTAVLPVFYSFTVKKLRKKAVGKWQILVKGYRKLL